MPGSYEVSVEMQGFKKLVRKGITLPVSSRIDVPLTLEIGSNNLFDRKYYSYALVNNPLAPTSFNAYPEARRNGYASVAYCW